ncbi:MAG TPA: bifunctional diaminohydroxyphosphoribosylaminopyrimidine deaminase/5-amino-6-(5-phosphoribosylamino)uracil reductase RibD [Cytophagales bacterium]|nr:bifunctional diaminohydroxyphosphoribosylaminopyrimidine deaminase/5-amino-6-(5-phosphoribosylamino)uracil reductase RibD [Cytophagales bacterium]
MSSSDDVYMKRCLELAKKGLGQVSPNPMVGAVIVYNDKIIGEGYHQNYGGPHAEVNAIKSLKDMSFLKDSTIYVNLEPCSFIGKTPACAELLKEKQFDRVVIGCKDPNPKVSGKGIEIIKNSGIKTECGVLEIESINLNKRFFINQNAQRPFIILKFAQTSDDFIARSDYSSKWISGPQSRAMVHQWRSEEDAIMTGNMYVPADDNTALVFRASWHQNRALTTAERTEYETGGYFHEAVMPVTYRTYANKDNDYLIDREKQRTVSYSGIKGIQAQDMAVIESMGAISDRNREHLGTSDSAIIGARRRLLREVRNFQEGIEPYAPQHGELYRIRSAAVEAPQDMPLKEVAAESMIL